MAYLDNNATTALSPEVLEAMLPFLRDAYGNPSSSNSLGAQARRAREAAREHVAHLLGASSPDEIVFTSCGTESDNWALFGAVKASGKKHIVTTAVEHDAVRKACMRLETEGCEVTWLDVDPDGAIDLERLRSALRPDTAVVTIMLANNETGILFPVQEAAAMVKDHSDALFHVDAVNAAGKVAIDLGTWHVDLLSISAHKFHGPKGVGALYVRRGVELPPLFVGGGQEAGRRPGTEAVHQIVGMGEAARSAADLTPMTRLRVMRDRLESQILSTIPRARINGTSDAEKRVPNTSSISFENANGEMILEMLEERGILVSTGSACNSADHSASHVLTAMDIPYSWAMGSIRFSLGRMSSDQDVDLVVAELPPIVAKLREIAGERPAAA